MTARTFWVARVKNMFDKRPRHDELTLRQLAELFDTPDVRDDKDGPGITLGRFSKKLWENDASADKKTGPLAKQYCLRSSGYLGDIDNKKGRRVSYKRVRKVLDSLGVAYMVHTTHSSRPDAPRFRFAIPFKRDLKGTPDEIAALYLSVHAHLDKKFKGALDKRSSPAFFAYEPATPDADYFDYFERLQRPLFDPYKVEPAKAVRSVPDQDSFDFPDESALPQVKLKTFRVKPEIRSKIEDGITGDRSQELAKIYVALHRHGMSPAQIAAVLWDKEHEISRVARTGKKGEARAFSWLCADIERVLSKVIEERESRDDELFRRYAYVERQKSYFDLDERKTLDHEQFINRHIAEYGGGQYNAHRFWQTNWRESNGTHVHDFTYSPGSSQLVDFEGRRCLNLWEPAKVALHAKPVSDKDVAPWLGLIERLLPDEDHREHLLDWMAFGVQNPGVKINHHPLLVGTHGCGKDSAFEPFFYSIAGSEKDRTNVQYISNEGLDKGWGYHLLTQVCSVQELREVYGPDRRRLSNRLKPMLAAPPPTVSVEEKYAHPFRIPNVILWVFFSNHADAIAVDDTERRFFCLVTHAKKLKATDARALWKWYGAGGLKKCARWLHDRDVRNFNPKAAAPYTAFHETLAEAGKTEVEAALFGMIKKRKPPFRDSLVCPFDAASAINDLVVGGNVPGGLRKTVTPQQVSTALTGLRWERLPRVDTTRHGKRLTKTIFISAKGRKEYSGKSPTELLAIYEQLP